MIFKLYALRIFSFKWDESLTFYRDKVGLPLKFADPEHGWAEFDLGGVSLAVERQAEGDVEAKNLVGRFVGASIQVEDIDETYRTMKGNGVIFMGPPEKQPWGGVLVHFKDPDNNILTLLG